MKTTFRLLFIAIIISSIILAVISVYNKEWEATTASLSLIIAIISAWIAFEVFRSAFDQKRPRLTIMPDMTSRYNLIQLTLCNCGQSPAYNINIDWEKRPVNEKGESISFNKYQTGEFEVLILNGAEKTSVPLNTQTNYFNNNANHEMNFRGVISYSLTNTKKKRIAESFQFSFEHCKESALYETEEPKTNYKLQEIPGILNDIKKEISKLNSPKETDN